MTSWTSPIGMDFAPEFVGDHAERSRWLLEAAAVATRHASAGLSDVTLWRDKASWLRRLAELPDGEWSEAQIGAKALSAPRETQDTPETDDSAADRIALLLLHPRGGQVKIDGFDLSGVTRGFNLRSRVGDTPTLVLELATRDVMVGGEMQVDIQPELRDALTALGWVSPEQARALLAG